MRFASKFLSHTLQVGMVQLILGLKLRLSHALAFSTTRLSNKAKAKALPVEDTNSSTTLQK